MTALDQQPHHRHLIVERCWGIDENNPKGCPFARFLGYESGFQCKATGKNTWQQTERDPKIEKAPDGFPIWCPLNDPAAIAAAARAEATIECRKIVIDKVISNKCPFNGDCAQCFLCDNTGGCIVRSDEEIAKLCNGARAEGARKEREQVLNSLYQSLMEKRFETELSSSHLVWSGDVEDMIDALRSQQPGGEDGGAGK